MRLSKWALLLLVLPVVAGCDSFQQTSTSELEEETMKRMNEWFENNGVDGDKLQSSFEAYFTSSGITEASDAKPDQYMDILTFIQEPDKFPPMKDKPLITKTMKKLGISRSDIQDKKQLDYYYQHYLDHKQKVDSSSSYFVFGATIETLNKIPRLGSPGLVAQTLKNQMNKTDLKKELYQKTIVMLFYFDMAMHLRQE